MLHCTAACSYVFKRLGCPTLHTNARVQVLQNFWLSIWSEKTTAWEHRVEAGAEEPFPSMRYMAICFSFGITSVCLSLGRAVTLVLATLHASQALHDALVDKLLTLPMSFFDTQPTGRLVNRFTKDVEACDITLQGTISSFTTCMTSVCLSIVVVASVTRGAIVLALVPLLLFYSVVQRYYLATSRELKRLDSIALSPIFSSFSETLAGLTTVRAFARQRLFAARNEELMNASNRAWWPIQVRGHAAWHARTLHARSPAIAYQSRPRTSTLLTLFSG
jgi:ABC-type multidrug transport system fused ATPase/permease subunit